uniref:RRM domain-containing protein n=1 Tax=Saimiri boliviensis boliviensis TaxID=39432 RepID=A0A2K6TBM3_SAIBB
MAAGRNQDATVYMGDLDEKAGPVVNTHMPKDRVTGQHQGYGFVGFLSEEDADYAIRIMNMIKLYGKPIRENKASAHNKNLDVGADIFIGNLDPDIGEKLLYDTFSAFGVILQTPKIMQDPDTGNSKGYAFINFISSDASDAAIEDSKGERHGSAAERLLAAQNPFSQADCPHQLFVDAPPPPSAPNPVVSSLGSGLPPQGMPPPGSFPPPVPPPGALPPGISPAMPHHLCLLGLQDMVPPSAGTTGAGHSGHGHSHPHPFPPGGMPHPGMSQMQLAHHGPYGLGHPHPPPQPPPGMPHPGPPPMGMPPRGPPFGAPIGHPGLVPPHGMHGLSSTDGSLPPPRPTAQPPDPPRGPLQGPVTQYIHIFLPLLHLPNIFSIPWTNQRCRSSLGLRH